MGRGGRGHQPQWNDGWQDPSHARYWRGSWGLSSRATEASTPQQFPRYDATAPPGRDWPAKGKGKQKDQQEGTLQDPEDMIVPDMQELLNHTKRAEQKVRQLTKQREAKATQWKTYVAKMKKAYLEEQQRHGRDLQRITEDLKKAVSAQDDARAQIRHMAYCLAEGVPLPLPAQTTTDDEAWDTMMGQWREEQQQDGPRAVLERAMAAGKERKHGPAPMQTEPEPPPMEVRATRPPAEGAPPQYAAPTAPDIPRTGEPMPGYPTSRPPYQGSPKPMPTVPSPTPAPRVRSEPEVAPKIKQRPGPYSPVPGSTILEKQLAAKRAAEEARMASIPQEVKSVEEVREPAPVEAHFLSDDSDGDSQLTGLE